MSAAASRALRAGLILLPFVALSLAAAPLGSMAAGLLPGFMIVPALALSDPAALRRRPGRALGACALAWSLDALGLAFALLSTLTFFLMLLALLPIALRPLWILGAARLVTPLRSALAAGAGLALILWPAGYLAWTSGLALVVSQTDGAPGSVTEPMPFRPEHAMALGAWLSATWLGALSGGEEAR